MKRRESLKFIGVGSITAGFLWESCKTDGTDKTAPSTTSGGFEVMEAGRQDFEIARDKKLLSEKFFDEHEMATIAVLADIIIPKDEVSGSATEAGVPDFIEFIVKDIPDHQVPMRGGLRWLDMQCLKRYGAAFVDCTNVQQLEMIDQIAYPKKAKPEMQPGVAFFNRMRDLTATGFFTSEIGVKDMGYVGNVALKEFPGVPEEVMKQYGLNG